MIEIVTAVERKVLEVELVMAVAVGCVLVIVMLVLVGTMEEVVKTVLVGVAVAINSGLFLLINTQCQLE
ncbi:hypothetical protein H920_03941 [Fukomys damarensis]|uniref:Uncharacterized protein n=1 Tax=Fukomys damarensis TaxID=885580 RepID=A0A091DVR5_FUKDA|nr:hypothetical protein H920_03941 [Fukomys damarensis]